MKVILASGSPRRQDLLKKMGIHFDIKIKQVNEIYPSNLKGTQVTDFLAKLKASAFKDEIKKNELIITADTIVWFNDQVLGKPSDEEDAINMLIKLSGKRHHVMSSVCFTTISQQSIINETTTVFFKPLDKKEITRYVYDQLPLDKAGSYGIQDWIGLVGIERIEGSYTNVVGLPTTATYSKLKEFLPLS